MRHRSQLTKLTYERAPGCGGTRSRYLHETVVDVASQDAEHVIEALEGLASVSTTLGRIVEALRGARSRSDDVVLVIGMGEVEADALQEEVRDRLGTVVDTMLPDLGVVTEAAAVLSQRNAQRRADLMAELGALTGEQIAEGRSRAENRHALAARWRKEGRIFGVDYRGHTVYPAFQFDDDGVLRPVVRQVLSALPRDRMTNWEVAFWWVSANPWLQGRRPVDLLEEGPAERLAEAAARLGAPSPL